MKDILGLFLTLISQFAGGPGPVENNLVRFGSAAVFWAVLLLIAWSRQRSAELPREKLLLWGFGLGLVREAYMFGQTAWRMIDASRAGESCTVTEPAEHALLMVAVIVVAGAFLRYMLDDVVLSRRYLRIGLGITAVSLVYTAFVWPPMLVTTPSLKFHQTWLAWLFHLPFSVMILAAIYHLRKKPGWLRNVVTAALALYFFSEVFFLLNYSTARAYATILCPLGNSFHILAIPLLGFVYLREQGLEKERAEAALRTYHDHLQELVSERTAELTNVNRLLQQEVIERRQAEESLARISQRDELILSSAGEGICGIDRHGRLIFVNPAAAVMLGYQAEELVGQYCHAAWHSYRMDGTLNPEETCPIFTSYRLGIAHNGDDEYFSRKDGSLFPVRYFSNPTYEKGELAGAVVVFQDITERKRSEVEIARRNASLAIQNAVAAALSQSLDVEVCLKSALDLILERLSMQVGLIFLWDADRKKLSLTMHSYSKAFEEIQALVEECRSFWEDSNHPLAFAQVQALPKQGREVPATDPGGKIHYLVSVPLVSKGRTIGVMTLASSRSNVVDQSDLDLLTAVGQQVGMAVENARMYQDVERWAVDLRRLHEISASLISPLDEKRITAQIAEQSTRLIDCQMASVFQWNEQAEQLEIIASYGMNAEEKQLIGEQLGTCELLASLTASPHTINIRDTREDARVPVSWNKQLDLRSILCLPIWGADQPLMYLCLFDIHHIRQWKPQELELMESFTARAAVALINASLHKQLEMAAALEERQRIAAEMHDGLAQTLGLLGLRVDQVSEHLGEDFDQDLMAAMKAIRDTVNDASIDVRRSIASLRDSPKPRISLQEHLVQLVERQAEGRKMRIKLVDRMPTPLFLSNSQLQLVLPLLQEALLNACNHAHASMIQTILEPSGQEVSLSVEDDGVGFVPQKFEGIRDHFGLSIMQARAVRIGGRLDIASICGQGTRVRLSWLPESDGASKPFSKNKSEGQ